MYKRKSLGVGSFTLKDTHLILANYNLIGVRPSIVGQEIVDCEATGY